MFHFRVVILSTLILSASASFSIADSLAKFAKTKRLDRGDAQDAIVIDNQTLRENRDAGSLTSCTGPIVEAPQAAERPDKQTMEKRRLHWRKEYQKQTAKIAKARAKLAELETKVANLDAQHFAAGNSGRAEASLRTRLAEAKTKRDVQAQTLAREEATLRSIIREARNEGAEPGWFRN